MRLVLWIRRSDGAKGWGLEIFPKADLPSIGWLKALFLARMHAYITYM